MEFMPQAIDVTSPTSAPSAMAQAMVEEEVAAAIEIGDQNNQQVPQQPPQQQLPPFPQQEKPIYFSDGVMYPSDLNQPSTSSGQSNDELQLALPNNLLEVCRHLF